MTPEEEQAEREKQLEEAIEIRVSQRLEELRKRRPEPFLSRISHTACLNYEHLALLPGP
jgi:hypothetical protein